MADPKGKPCHRYRDCVFAAVPAGNFNGSFNNAGNNANFWSSSQNSSNNAWNRNYNNAGGS